MNDRLPGTTWSNPIWHRGWRIYISDSPMGGYAYVHDDFDGAVDANDSRHGGATTVKAAKAEIDAYEEEHAAVGAGGVK